MHVSLRFKVPAAPQAAKETLARLHGLVESINEDKEEQALEPAFFAGNLADYPAWLGEAFANETLKAELERFGACEAGELAEYDLETWYEDLLAGETWHFNLRPLEGARHALTFQAEDKHYGGDLAPAWILLAAGAQGLERHTETEETKETGNERDQKKQRPKNPGWKV